MSSETDLLRSLDDEPGAPSTVDPRRAITTARKRRARRRAGYAGAAALTVVAITGASVAAGLTPGRPNGSPAAKATATTSGAPAASTPVAAPMPPAPENCTLRRLTAPGKAPMALVGGADPTGRYIVGRSYPKSGGYQAVLWKDGKGRDVMLPGDSEEMLSDVNSAGTAVGWSFASSRVVPYAFHQGKVSKLPGVRHGSAYAINEAGAVVGDDDAGHALMWPSVTAKPKRLPAPAGAAKVRASDIDADGTVVGGLDYGTPYAWFPDGTHRALPMPLIDGKPAEVAQAFTIRNGWVTGMAAPTSPKGKPAQGGKHAAYKIFAARWNLRTGATEIVGSLQYPADAVNAFGWQIGTDRKGQAVLIAGETTVVLPGLGKHGSDGTATIAKTLSDDGRFITGQSDDKDGVIQAVVWRCD